MGGEQSSPQPTPTPPPSPTFAEPWRKLPLNHMATVRTEVENFCPSIEAVKHVRIMLNGPAGSGKSSFINSVNSVLQGRITTNALVDAMSGESFTKMNTYKIEKGEYGNYYPFVLNDTMGLEKQKGRLKEDIILAIGHFKDGYKFNPVSPLTEGDPGFKSCPAIDDKVHILVSVIPADTISRMEDDVRGKMRDIRSAASNLGIPQMAIVTKIDLACPLVGKNLKDVYKSKLLKQWMTELSHKTGIPMNCIFPVKNYHEETSVEDDMDLLILHALRQMLHLANDCQTARSPMTVQQYSLEYCCNKLCDGPKASRPICCGSWDPGSERTPCIFVNVVYLPSFH